jgi:hypothetical protein
MIIKPSIYNCSVVELKKVHKLPENLTPVEGRMDIPFNIKRLYYLYDIPGGANRSGHAHKILPQLIVAACGCFDGVLDDGQNRTILNYTGHIIDYL